MTKGIGGLSAPAVLSTLKSRRAAVQPITAEEYRARIEAVRAHMAARKVDALLLPASSNLLYFTGLDWHPSERLTAAVILKDGDPVYVCPAFEEPKLRGHITVGDEVRTWQEDESAYALVADLVRGQSGGSATVAVDALGYAGVFFDLAATLPQATLVDARPLTEACRRVKSAHEIALLSHAKALTLEVHRLAAGILRPGITPAEVVAFIGQAHRALGADGGNTFCAVQFGEATAYPHGAPGDWFLKEGDPVLIDTGCAIEGYKSDITRCYTFGHATPEYRRVWEDERDAQMAAFNAAHIGVPCEAVDIAARSFLESRGYGPGYQVPGCPHRTGHGVGLDLHEPAYIVGGNKQPLEAGLCFSVEPMLCLYGKFGVRFEDHVYMTEDGPRWFTIPPTDVDNPFGLHH
ncbi:M24 family metallopeptidase [Nitrospirillum amazonense]|uniref:Xaa-Pro dipeptidase n=1 Tax=Nitrospirillum amazonense TaxID=28077 RepID=A0A560JPM8_9PROT|nr:Xaa-Pro peptidase family protein [Nitrospirillum amazonense]MDG3442391.1 Xaa-Pro peptidase family protein [Nitrospirillum amazonense]TWB73112.1 Xaa-Pro dipeptidase [Nitrospirillum amazonense]